MRNSVRLVEFVESQSMLNLLWARVCVVGIIRYFYLIFICGPILFKET